MSRSHVYYDSFSLALLLLCKTAWTWLIHLCAMTHSYVCLDLFICVPCLIHMCAMPHSYVCHASLIHLTWLIHTCDTSDTSDPYMWHGSFTCVTCLIHTCEDASCHVCWSIGLYCGNLGLFGEQYMALFIPRVTSHLQDPTMISNSNIGLFCGNVGLFCRNIWLFS